MNTKDTQSDATTTDGSTWVGSDRPIRFKSVPDIVAHIKDLPYPEGETDLEALRRKQTLSELEGGQEG